jgi:hypothetical protein
LWLLQPYFGALDTYASVAFSSSLVGFSSPDASTRSFFVSGSDVWRVVDNNYGQAVGKLQAESMMSTAASLFPQ